MVEKVAQMATNRQSGSTESKFHQKSSQALMLLVLSHTALCVKVYYRVQLEFHLNLHYYSDIECVIVYSLSTITFLNITGRLNESGTLDRIRTTE